MTEQLWWYVARSGGVVALVLACLSVVWGLLLSSKYLKGGPRPKWLLDMHNFLGGLTVIFTVVHMAGLWFDSFVTFSVADLLVPFASNWRPVEVAAGVIAFWLLLAVQLTSMIRHRLSRRWWKIIHLGSYLLLPLGAVHGITAGTDAQATWFQLGLAGLLGLVCYLTAWRAVAVPNRARRAALSA